MTTWSPDPLDQNPERTAANKDKVRKYPYNLSMPTKINIFEYENYRLYLDAKMQDYKEKNPKMSLRLFSKAAGFGSHSFMAEVIAEKRNLTDKTIEGVVKIFELGKDEAFYFRNLVFFNQAASIEDRQIFAQQILKCKGYKKVRPLAEYQHHFFTRWHVVAIWELISLRDFNENPKTISKRLCGLISPEEAKTAIEELIKLGLAQRDSSGKLSQIQDYILTPDEVTSSFAALYHQQMIKLGQDAIGRFPRSIREVSGLTFGVTKANVANIKELMQRFYKELTAIVAGDKGKSELVYQFNQQLFPLALATEDLNVNSQED